MSGYPKAVVNAIYRRAGGDGTLGGWGPHCEACGGPGGMGGFVLHHRLLRSAGGPNTVANLMLVHGFSYRKMGGCHTLTEWSIHQNPERSYRLGHMLHRGQDPETVGFIVAPDLRTLRA